MLYVNYTTIFKKYGLLGLNFKATGSESPRKDLEMGISIRLLSDSDG